MSFPFQCLTSSSLKRSHSVTMTSATFKFHSKTSVIESADEKNEEQHQVVRQMKKNCTKNILEKICKNVLLVGQYRKGKRTC